MAEYNLAYDRYSRAWIVEWFDDKDGACMSARFYGPLAEERAHAYRNWANAGFPMNETRSILGAQEVDRAASIGSSSSGA